MFHVESYQGTLAEQYQRLNKQLTALLDGEDDQIATLANAAALLNQFLSDVNWVGFYLIKGEQLVLGPFQGLPACVRIPLGKGVCGTSALKRETLRIADVHAFPGHIACDAASRSEIVIPLIKDGHLIGVLDIDSPLKDRFSEEEQDGLEQFVKTLINYLG
ncbi:GAF domain-containing protein [Halalkalibacterium ligniniphilum]|uniref:GAF domain-containing protein n=1 Tax=Halalkalibacterium ligniniphilum TaxID=1134413 RepID=UPI00034A9E04|nr:GAF domain-containing protein [Halalkalibacterium ligniniphilum]